MTTYGLFKPDTETTAADALALFDAPSLTAAEPQASAYVLEKLAFGAVGVQANAHENPTAYELRGDFGDAGQMLTLRPVLPVLTFDNATTRDGYSARDPKPTHAAYRGGHELSNMSQQLGRDLAGERYARQPLELRLFKTTEEYRQRANTDYLYIVQTPTATAETAFMTAEELYSWLRAYAVSMTPKPSRWCADFILTTGDPADWEPLELRPL